MVYFAVTSKNRYELSVKMLQSVFSQTYKDIKVYWVDDGSEERNVELLKTQFPGIVFIQEDGNQWWTGGTNRAIQEILKIAKPTDYILIQNQDAIMENNFVEELVCVSEMLDGALVGGTVKSSNGSKIVANAHMLDKGAYLPKVIDTNERYFDSDTLVGRGSLIPVWVIQKIGLFDSRLPHYGSDYDFFLKAKKLGYRLVMAQHTWSYTQDDNKGLAYRIKQKYPKSISDIRDLLFHRRSSNNIYSSFTIILRYSPLMYKGYAIIRYLMYILKLLIWDVLIGNIFVKLRHEK